MVQNIWSAIFLYLLEHIFCHVLPSAAMFKIIYFSMFQTLEHVCNGCQSVFTQAESIHHYQAVAGSWSPKNLSVTDAPGIKRSWNLPFSSLFSHLLLTP